RRSISLGALSRLRIVCATVISLGDGDFSHFIDCAREITVAQTILSRDNAPSEIDRLRTCWLEKRPVYIGIPSDVGYATIDLPSTPLTLPEPTSDATQLRNFLDAALQLLHEAIKPTVLAGFEVDRYGLEKPDSGARLGIRSS